jgi:glucan phosphoethanolaminetransferase (alkaline phosphatase superfamily)
MKRRAPEPVDSPKPAPAQARRTRALTLGFVSVWAVLSAGAWAFSAWAGAPAQAYPLNALLMLAWSSVFAAGAQLLPQRLRRWAWPPIMALAVQTAAWAILGAVVARILWGVNPDRMILAEMAGYLGSLSGLAGIPLWMLWLLLSLPGLLAWALFQWSAWRRGAQDGRRSRYLLALGLVGIVTNAALFWDGAKPAAERKLPFWAWHWDPLISAWHLQEQSCFRDTPARRAAMVRDAEARAAYVPAPRSRRKHVIVIVIDALRPDHLPHYGYGRQTSPFLTRLSQEGHWKRIRRAYTQAPESLGGICSLVQPRWPKSLFAAGFGLPQALRANGYQTHFFLGGTHRWFGLQDAYGTDAADLRTGQGEPPAAVNDDRGVVRAVEGLAPDDGGRHFIMVHLMSVHEVGVFDTAYARWAPTYPWALAKGRLKEAPDEERAQALRNEYDGRILQADAYLERIWQALRRKGYLDDAVVAIVSDHGQGMGENDRWGHCRELVESIVRIPLFFWSDRALSVRDDGLAAIIDVAPTLMAEAGLPIPASWDGRALVPGQRPRTLVAMQDQMLEERFGAFVWDSPWGPLKYHRLATPLGEPRVRLLFQLDKDPGEKNNVWNSSPESVRTAVERLDEMYLDERKER